MSNNNLKRILVLDPNVEASLDQLTSSDRLSVTRAFDLIQQDLDGILSMDTNLQKLILKDRNLYEYTIPTASNLRIIMEVREQAIVILQVFEKDKSKTPIL
ncbi:MAG: hypothetical protein H7Y37_14155 [Anaerolineae bacterium]|nr:hypothetical protein [Gloeobacterales cyanobacterium ES-bin-313]